MQQSGGGIGFSRSLAGSLASGNNSAPDDQFDGILFLMGRAGFVFDAVGRGCTQVFLAPLLHLSFRVLVCGEGVRMMGSGFEEVLEYTLGSPHATVDIDGSEKSLQRVSKVGFPVGSTGSGFTSAEAEVLAESGLPGEFGKMVALRGDTITSVSIAEAIAEPKLVDPDGELVRQARQAGVSFGA